MTAKRDLLNYLQFLQESGFLYIEGVNTEKLFGLSSIPASKPRPAVPDLPVANRKIEHAKKDEPTQSDLFRAPSAMPLRKPAAPPLKSEIADAAKDSGVLGGEDLPREERIKRLAALTAQAEACRACALGNLRNKLVFADGDPESRIAFVGEAPGGEENEQGIPFVGRAGQLLNKMIVAIGFKREEVYICNTIKCRPPENRDPLPGEKAACEHFLVSQLEVVRPKLLVALGAHAAQYLCRSELGIGKLRGGWHSYHGIPLLATYHPAFLLRSPSFKVESWIDFQKIHRKYAELCPDDARKVWKKDV